MNGLELAERYFTVCGLPLLRNGFPALLERAASGLIGLGSECLGFDDEISRDHDWGPGFCLWLTSSDYEQFGRSLTAAYKNLPKVFEGFERKISEWGDGRVGIFEIGRFYRSLIGRNDAPQTVHDWLRLQETNLSVAAAGKVFYDPLGEFSEIRQKLLDFYPDDVRTLKIAARCMVVGQSGQYNYQRCLWRHDYFAAQYAETKFCSDVMSLIYLLNRRYAPYYKWMMRGVEDLPLLGAFIFEKITDIMTSGDHEKKRIIIDEICAAVVAQLQSEGLSDSASRFLIDHGQVIHEKIIDPSLQNMNVWVG
ncbi:MAG: DUF4037 domain-containing protein [Desulfuromonadaceae bacterium]|nr:DUF4037 domain-containing protein [Desulfuromonadaceae bacterium]